MTRSGAACLATGLLILCMPARAGSGMPDPRVEQLLAAVTTGRVDCSDEVASMLRPSVRLDCGAVEVDFKHFKRVWERVAGRPDDEDAGGLSAVTRWHKWGKHLRRRYYWSGEAPLLVLFDPEGRQVILARYEVQQVCRERARQHGIDFLASAELQRDASTPQQTRHEAPEFPEKGRITRLGAVVLLWFVVDVRGEVTELCLVGAKPRGYGFEMAAMEAAQQWRYEPASKGGRTVAAEILTRVTFELSAVPLPYRDLLDSFFLNP